MTTAETTATEREHLQALSMDQLREIAAYNELEVKARNKTGIVDAILDSPELPAYPEGIPAFIEGQAVIGSENVDPQDLATEDFENTEYDAAMGAASIPSAAPAPTQLFSTEGLGERPTKSVINIPALRLEVPAEYSDGDELTVTATIRVEEIKFFNEKVGKTGTRRVRGHSAKYVAPRENATIKPA